jgi:hypothetical protein
VVHPGSLDSFCPLIDLASIISDADVIKRRDTPKSLTQQGKFKTYLVAMSGVLDSNPQPPILTVSH